MARASVRLTEKQWRKLEPLLPPRPARPRGGRRWISHRSVLEGVLWVLKTGARWRDLPDESPSAATCWRRLRRWEEDGVWLRIWRAYLSELDARGRLHWEETFIDGTFSPAKKGGRSRENQAGQGQKAHGGGRRPGSSFGSFHRLGLSGGGHARRGDAPNDRRPAARSRATADPTGPTDRGQGLRQ